MAVSDGPLSVVATGPCFMRQYRLTRNSDFQRVRREGKSSGSPWLKVYASPNSLSFTRYGFSISKRVGKAVVRNRVRRRLREIMRLYRNSLAAGWDVVVVARQQAAAASFQQLQAALGRVLARLGVLKAGQPFAGGVTE